MVVDLGVEIKMGEKVFLNEEEGRDVGGIGRWVSEKEGCEGLVIEIVVER